MAKKIRQNGEGTYYKQPNGIWQYKITVGRDDNGKMIRKTFYGSSGPEAKGKADLWKQQNDEISYTVSPDIKLSEWVDIWLRNTKKGTIRGSSYRQLEILGKHISPKLLNKKVCDIAPIELQGFLNAFASGRSKSYVDKMGTLLKSVFSDAHDNSLCVKNPAAKLIKPQIKTRPREAYTSKEVSTIIEFAEGYKESFNSDVMKESGAIIGVAVTVLLFTGMRRGELLGVQWGDITKEAISIRRGVFLEDGVPKVIDYQAKTAGSIREIPIPEFLFDRVQELPKKGLFVFAARTGKIMHPRNFNRAYDTFFEKIKIKHPEVRDLSPHSCRHTYATLTLDGGADIRTVQELLGHTNINTTAIYTHPDFKAKQAALNGLVALVSQDTKQDIKPKKALKSSKKAKTGA